MSTVASLVVKIGADTSGLDSGVKKADKKVTGFKDKASSAIGSASKFALPVVGAVAAIGGASLKAAIDFEAGFADVIKSVNGTDAQLDALKANIKTLATESDLNILPNAHAQLTEIAALAGQLGVKTDDIDEFTASVGAMTVATDMTADSAATFAAQFANVTGMDIGTDIDNLADAIVTLGNNSATNESSIANTANRLAGLASLKIPVDDILGLAAAIPSLGLSSELGATNVTKTITDMVGAAATGGPKMKAFAGVLGVTSDEFENMIDNNPADAFMLLLENIGQMDSKTAIKELTNLGITSTEQQQTIMKLAGGFDTVTNAMALAEEGYAGNGAAMEEVVKKGETAEGQMAALGNKVNDLAIKIGDFLLPAFKKGVDGATKFIDGLSTQNTDLAVEGILEIVEALTGRDDIVTGIGAWGDALFNFGRIVKIVLDDFSRRWEIAKLDLTTGALEAQIAMTEMLPEAMRDNAALEGLRTALTETKNERFGFEFADRLNDGIRDGLRSGNPVTLDDMITIDENYSPIALRDALLGGINNGFLNEGTMSELFKINMADLFAQSLTTGDSEMTNALMPLTDFMSFDPGELRTALQDAMALAVKNDDLNQAILIYNTAMEIDADVDMEKFYADMESILAQQKLNATVKADVTVKGHVIDFSLDGMGGGRGGQRSIPIFHSGGVFRSPTGEGLAMLKDGERVLSPQETRAYDRGGSGVVINYSSFGETPYNALKKIQRAAKDNGY